MNWTGVITGVACFAMIGLFHPTVIYTKAEAAEKKAS